MMKSTLAGAAAAALFALGPGAALAQNETVPGNVTVTTGTARTTPPETESPDTTPLPPPVEVQPSVPAPGTSDTVVTTTTTAPPADLVLPPLEPVNPYANSYNDLEPLMVEEDEGFDEWGLFGLLGLLGLLGLRRGRDRIVYVERAETEVRYSPDQGPRR